MGVWSDSTSHPRPVSKGNRFQIRSKGWDGLRNQIYNHMRKEYQIRWNEEIIFRSESWQTVNAMLDDCPEDSYLYEDVFFDDEPYKE